MGRASTGKRVWVLLAAVVLLAFAIVAVAHCSSGYNTFCLVVNILTIIGCVLGIVGALRLHAGMLNMFCVTLVLLIVLEIIYIILAFVNDYSARDVLWGFIVLGLLAITLAFSVDLRNAVAGTMVLA